MPRARFRRIPRRYAYVVMSVVLSVCMSAVISLIVTIKNNGIEGRETAMMWLAAWQASCLIAVPMRFLVAPLVARFVGLLVEPPLEN